MALLDPLYRRGAGHHLIRMAKVKNRLAVTEFGYIFLPLENEITITKF